MPTTKTTFLPPSREIEPWAVEIAEWGEDGYGQGSDAFLTAIEMDEDGLITLDLQHAPLNNRGAGVPEAIWNRRTLTFDVPTSIDASWLVGELGNASSPLRTVLDRIHAAHVVEWSDRRGGYVGFFPDEMAGDSLIYIVQEILNAAPTHDYEVWGAEEWMLGWDNALKCISNLVDGWEPSNPLPDRATLAQLARDAADYDGVVLHDVEIAAETILAQAREELEELEEDE